VRLRSGGDSLVDHLLGRWVQKLAAQVLQPSQGLGAHGQPAPAAAGAIQDCPDQAQAAGLAGEPTDHLSPAAGLPKGPLDEVRVTDAVPMLGGEPQVDRERGQVIGDTGNRRRVAGPPFGRERRRLLAGDGHGLVTRLEEVERFGLDLVLPWLRARLDYAKSQAASHHYIGPLPDKLQPLLHARQRRAAAKRELKRLLDELEAGASGWYQLNLGQAVDWLGIDSSDLTRRINEWARAGEDKRTLAFAFLASASWPVFTKRAHALLDVRPGDSQVREALLRARDPFSSINLIRDLEQSYRACADEYQRWTRSHDPRLRELGREAVGRYERLADEEAAKQRREREHI
jgi:hypothetical protein